MQLIGINKFEIKFYCMWRYELLRCSIISRLIWDWIYNTAAHMDASICCTFSYYHWLLLWAWKIYLDWYKGPSLYAFYMKWQGTHKSKDSSMFDWQISSFTTANPLYLCKILVRLIFYGAFKFYQKTKRVWMFHFIAQGHNFGN